MIFGWVLLFSLPSVNYLLDFIVSLFANGFYYLTLHSSPGEVEFWIFDEFLDIWGERMRLLYYTILSN